MSLGGYTVALLAGIEPGLDGVVAGIPVADFPGLFHRHSPRHIRVRAIEHRIMGGTAEDVYRVVSPLASTRWCPPTAATSSPATATAWPRPTRPGGWPSTGAAPRCPGTPATTSATCGPRQVTEFVEASLAEAAGVAPGRTTRVTEAGLTVETMSGLDAKFLYSETPTAHMHTIKVAVADVSGLEDGFSFATMTEVLGQLLVRLPPFRRRVVPVPFGLGHPVWVEDPDFDLARHLSRVVLDPPGDDRALARAIGDFAGTVLPRDRPCGPSGWWSASPTTGSRWW